MIKFQIILFVSVQLSSKYDLFGSYYKIFPYILSLDLDLDYIEKKEQDHKEEENKEEKDEVDKFGIS